MEVTVTGCRDCPLLNWKTDECNHPGLPSIHYGILTNWSEEVEPFFPNWCPFTRRNNTDPILTIKI